MPPNDTTARGASSHAQKDETPTTGQTVAGAKLKQTKRIVTHAAHALCATFLSVHPAITCALLTLALGAWHGL